jgi:FHA domain-containing protein
MKITVVGGRGAAGAAGLSAEFGASGGTIGRATTNALVLEDPDRTVSRMHAQVICRDGIFFMVDRGSNPLSRNGVSVGSGNEVPLADGDRLQIGGFELAVSSVASSADSIPVNSLGQNQDKGLGVFLPASVTADDPFADLLEGLIPAPVAKPVATAPSAPVFFPDPMGVNVPAQNAGKVDPFDDLLSGLGGTAPLSGGGLGGVLKANAPSIDELFGLGASSAGSDPFAASPLANPLMRPNTSSSADPLVALQSAPKITAPSRSDHVPLLRQAYSMPAEVQVKPPAEPSPAKPPIVANAHADRVGVVPLVSKESVNKKQVAASDDELLAAFLRGVKTSHQMPTELTPELMELIGTLLHSATYGTLQLLLSRQEFKRGVRSEVTMIAVDANNPLKFSPTAEVALAHMLGPRIKGFMAPEEAMNNAYADLRAHQFGVMVGLRAALVHVIDIFMPEKLENRLTEKTALDSLFTANRKAKLWDQFCQLYSNIATEAEDDFHTLFGKAFTQAYDEQMARFKSGGKA